MWKTDKLPEIVVVLSDETSLSAFQLHSTNLQVKISELVNARILSF